SSGGMRWPCLKPLSLRERGGGEGAIVPDAQNRRRHRFGSIVPESRGRQRERIQRKRIGASSPERTLTPTPLPAGEGLKQPLAAHCSKAPPPPGEGLGRGFGFWRSSISPQAPLRFPVAPDCPRIAE